MAATLFIINIPKEKEPLSAQISRQEISCCCSSPYCTPKKTDTPESVISPIAEITTEKDESVSVTTFWGNTSEVPVGDQEEPSEKKRKGSGKHVAVSLSVDFEDCQTKTTATTDLDQYETDYSFSGDITDDSNRSETIHGQCGVANSTSDNWSCGGDTASATQPLVSPESITTSVDKIPPAGNRFQVSEVPNHEIASPKSHTEMLDFLPKESRETILKNTLEGLSISNDIWLDAGSYKQVTFIDCGGSERVEEILKKLMDIGIGQKIRGSSISVFPASVHVETLNDEHPKEKKASINKENESKFKKSVKSRLVVAQVVETVKTNAVFTFDYCMLIILASMIATVGLVENSSVVLVASMLISPLMGPILAGTFGIMIQNYPLRNLGLRSEAIGLAMCIICGFVFGLIIGTVQLHGFQGYIEEWPTMEMKSRGMARSLWIGILIALPSGAGVSLSVLGGNAGPLVGVAISASLLPPAVNAGMLWSFALLTVISPLQTTAVDNSTMIPIDDNKLGCLSFKDNDYKPVYSCNMAKEMGIMGAISLLLTLLNIICIFLVGVIMLKIKEVVPQISSEGTADFWERDLRVARDSYKTMKGTESLSLRRRFLNEYQKLMNKGNFNDMGNNDIMHFKRIIRDVEDDLHYSHITSPKTNVTHFDFNPTSYLTLQHDQASLAETLSGNAYTIHNTTQVQYTDFFNYEPFMASPGVRVACPFSFAGVPPHSRTTTHKGETTSARSTTDNRNRVRKPRFWLKPLVNKKRTNQKSRVVVGKEKEFTVTSVPEFPSPMGDKDSSLMVSEDVV